MSYPTNRHPVLVIIQSPCSTIGQGTTVKRDFAVLRVLMAAHARLLPFGKGSLGSILLKKSASNSTAEKYPTEVEI